jgi:guanyl-specific ribonuclease Sa
MFYRKTTKVTKTVTTTTKVTKTTKAAASSSSTTTTTSAASKVATLVAPVAKKVTVPESVLKKRKTLEKIQADRATKFAENKKVCFCFRFNEKVAPSTGRANYCNVMTMPLALDDEALLRGHVVYR